MALAATTIFEIQSTATANNVNGGGFNPSNANMMTDLTTDANTANTNSPVASSATYNFVAGDVGHWLYIKSGTNWTPGWYQIASVASNKATLSAAVGSAVQLNTNTNLYGTNTVAGCATVGTPTSGTFTIDYSQGTTAILALTDGASVNNSSVLTSATGGFTKAMIGNLVHITAGTQALTGWYELVNHTDTNTVTLDRDCANTADMSGATFKVGGALSLNSSDDAVFELAVSSATAAARYFVKGNASYTINGSVAVAAAGNAQAPIWIEAYASKRGDRPKGSTRATFACGANDVTFGAQWNIWGVIFTGTFTTMITMGALNKYYFCKFYNSSTGTNRIALQMAASCIAHGCEAISIRGRALATNGARYVIESCYAHHSDIGFQPNNSDGWILNSISACNVTSCIDYQSVPSNLVNQRNCTMYGWETPTGNGIKLANSTGSNLVVTNSIFYGFVNAWNPSTAQTMAVSDYNTYFNNTTDISDTTKMQKGANDIALNPSFTSMTERSGSTATTTTGNHLVQSGATFQTWGVAAGDFMYVVSGTGITNPGIYEIQTVDSENQVTFVQSIPANATSDKVWRLIQGFNFAVGTNMKAVAFPGAFPGANTTGYLDIGAVQRQEAAAAGGGSGGTKAYLFC